MATSGTAPWSENAHKVVVEFKRASGKGKREIKLSHLPDYLPAQLQGRMKPETWAAFMQRVQAVAAQHPYTAPPSAKRVCGWAGGAVMGALVGICCVKPDGGDYETWLPQVDALISEWGPAFGAVGALLTRRSAQQSHWLQIDIDPAAPAKAA